MNRLLSKQPKAGSEFQRMEKLYPNAGRVLHCVLLLDQDLPGAECVEHNVHRIAEGMARLSELSGVKHHLIRYATLLPGETLRMLKTTIASLNTEPCCLLLYLNGHSRLWKGQEAIHEAKQLGETQMLAKDQDTVRFSSLMARDRVVLSPTRMHELLCAVPKQVQRTLLFLDTCHSMSLVSVLVCPPIHLRTVHSTGEDEKTYQTLEGSVLSRLWVSAISKTEEETIQKAQALISAKSSAKRKEAEEEYREYRSTIFWKATQHAAREIACQILTTGPDSAFVFY